MHDVVEGQFVYDLVCSLIEQNHAGALGENGANLPKLVSVLASILNTQFCSDELTPRVVNILRQVHSSLASADFDAIVQSLDNEVQANVAKALQS